MDRKAGGGIEVSREKLSDIQKQNMKQPSWSSYLFLYKTNRTKGRIVLCLDCGTEKEYKWRKRGK